MIRILTNLHVNLIAVVLLVIMIALATLSMRNDSLTFDELAHITAGYSYLTALDYRINPEHPPLIKDIAAVPLTLLNLTFPFDSQNWRMDAGAPPWWVQFDLGREFLYRSGNNPREIIFWSRLPMIFTTAALGLFLFFWAKKIAGPLAGLGTVFLFAFSPTFLAHGRFVATDIGAVFGVCVALSFWISFLQKPTSVWRIIGAAVGFGFAMLLKFSLILLLPTFGITMLLAATLYTKQHPITSIARYTSLSVVVGLLSLLVVISPFYSVHIKNYPAHRQLRDTIADLQPDGITFYENIFGVYGADKPLLRPTAQFFRGVLMAAQRVQFGNTVYFLGKVKGNAFWYYFPIIFLVKLPPGLLIIFGLGAMGLGLSMVKTWRQFGLSKGVPKWIKHHFTLTSLIIFSAIYWFVALVGNLNIGIRHVSITIPLFYLLSMWGIRFIFKEIHSPNTRKIFTWVVGGSLGWYLISSLIAFPQYLSYYNVFGGGISNGYKIAVDSNYDWGQDFYRLVDFIEENNIEKITLDYFGGEDPAYWLGDKAGFYNPQNESEHPTGWFAVSVNQLMGGIGTPVYAKNTSINSGYYKWLETYEPVARAGTSIFIYNIPE